MDPANQRSSAPALTPYSRINALNIVTAEPLAPIQKYFPKHFAREMNLF